MQTEGRMAVQEAEVAALSTNEPHCAGHCARTISVLASWGVQSAEWAGPEGSSCQLLGLGFRVQGNPKP